MIKTLMALAAVVVSTTAMAADIHNLATDNLFMEKKFTDNPPV
jgi:hypothetical protein